MSHLSFEGQTKDQYCEECMQKHGQTAKVFMKECLQRAEVCGNGSCEGVVEKVRGVAEELAGYESDSQSTQNPEIIALNAVAREIRKWIFSVGGEIGQASMEQLRELKEKIELLVDKTYGVRPKVDCLACKIEVEQQQPEKPSIDTFSDRRRQLLEEIKSKFS